MNPIGISAAMSNRTRTCTTCSTAYANGPVRLNVSSLVSLSTVTLVCGGLLCNHMVPAAVGYPILSDTTGAVRSVEESGYRQHTSTREDKESSSSSIMRREDDVELRQLELIIKQGGGSGPDEIEAFPFRIQSFQSDGAEEACHIGWDVSCRDDPTYRSRFNLRCHQHIKFDCLSFLGTFSEEEVAGLIESCPCSCGFECGSFSWEPSASPSSSPTTSHKPTPVPTVSPTSYPSANPSTSPSNHPSSLPSPSPSTTPSSIPSAIPTLMPSSTPTLLPSSDPSFSPSETLSLSPSSRKCSTPRFI
mmetsp:Transcript_11535/g.23665  ORF Transcript_11535/g.23665 Transcript_11535/m.23665 type:complete len:304 (+) Transcript_11535:587-1498(+)